MVDNQNNLDGGGGRGSGNNSASGSGKRRHSSKPIDFFFTKRIKTPTSDSNCDPTTSAASASVRQPQYNIIRVTETDESLTGSTSAASTSTEAADNDIGVYVGKANQLDDFTKCRLLENPWFPPAGSYDFPYSVHSKGGKDVKRYVQPYHLKNYHWLVLSNVHRGLYCKYCVIFAGAHGMHMHQSNSSLGYLVKKPLTSFAKLYGKDGYITVHENTKYHKDAVNAGKNFLISYHAPELEVVNQINTQRLAQVQENRARLRPIIETIILCGRQNIPLRGHRDDGSLLRETATAITEGGVDSITNEGNFRELLRFRIAAGDTELEKQLKNSAANATYISKTTQNALINCCGEEIQNIIFERVCQAKWFALIFDETTDAAHKEQMSISVRYVHEGTCREDFLAFIDCYESIRTEDIQGEEKRLSGIALAHIVIEFCEKHSLDLNNCVGVGTDNCSVMASEMKGAVQEICKTAPNARRCPCLNHTLNNSLKKSNEVIACRNTVSKMKEIISFSNSSAKATAVFRNILGKSFSGLCETRWQEKHDGTIQFCTLLPKIFSSLEKITKWTISRDTVSKAHAFMKSITDSDFIIATFALGDVLGTTLVLSRILQSPTLDALSAINAVKDVLSVFKKKREDAVTVFRNIYLRAEEMAKILDVEITSPRTARRSVYRANHPTSDQGPEAYFRTSIYIPLLDQIVNDLQNRLPDDVMNTFDLRLLMPSVIVNTFTESTNLAETNNSLQNRIEKISQVYERALNDYAVSLKPEYAIWIEKWRRLNREKGEIPTTVLSTLRATDEDMFPAIHIMLKILATLPVSVATAERSFSTLRRLKPWLRTRTAEERLTGLALLHVHPSLDFDVDNVINRYAKGKRKIDLIL